MKKTNPESLSGSGVVVSSGSWYMGSSSIGSKGDTIIIPRIIGIIANTAI